MLLFGAEDKRGLRPGRRPSCRRAFVLGSWAKPMRNAYSRRLLCGWLGALLGAFAVATPATAQQPAARLVLEAAEVTPAKAPADALCQLRARIKNGGTTVATAFVFALEIDGKAIAVYRNHVFMDPIEPGETRSIKLYGFWTSETGRPLPASGDLEVELTLQEARWMKMEKDAEGARVWQDLGAVEGLPQTVLRTVELVR